MQAKFEATKDPKYLYRIKKIKAKTFTVEVEETDRDSIM